MMPATAKDHRISVRIASDTAAWLEHRGGENKAGFVRQLIERERAREQAEELLAVFNQAAADLTPKDLEERETLLDGFAGGAVVPRFRIHAFVNGLQPGLDPDKMNRLLDELE